MNRMTIVSLATAAAVGSAGGVAFAVGSAGDPAEPSAAHAPTGTTPTPSPTPTVDATADLFYYLHGTIHDGDAKVRVRGIDPDQVTALQRAGAGYLVVYYGPHEDQQTGVYVDGAGKTWSIGVFRTWQVTQQRDRIYFDSGYGWEVADLAARRTRAVADVGFPTVTDPDLARRGLVDPVTSEDGSYVAATYDNPDYSPTHPVGSCLSGGPVADPGAWWRVCETGPASDAPFSADGRKLLTTTTVGDGPGPSELQVRNADTGEVERRIDPGGYRIDAAWGPEPGTVSTVTGDDASNKVTLSRCVVATGHCTAQLRAEGTLVLGSR